MAPIRHMTDINNVADMEELAEWMRTKKVKNWSDKEKTQLELAARKLFVSLEGKSPPHRPSTSEQDRKSSWLATVASWVPPAPSQAAVRRPERIQSPYQRQMPSNRQSTRFTLNTVTL